VSPFDRVSAEDSDTPDQDVGQHSVASGAEHPRTLALDR